MQYIKYFFTNVKKCDRIYEWICIHRAIQRIGEQVHRSKHRIRKWSLLEWSAWSWNARVCLSQERANAVDVWSSEWICLYTSSQSMSEQILRSKHRIRKWSYYLDEVAWDVSDLFVWKSRKSGKCRWWWKFWMDLPVHLSTTLWVGEQMHHYEVMDRTTCVREWHSIALQRMGDKMRLPSTESESDRISWMK